MMKMSFILIAIQIISYDKLLDRLTLIITMIIIIIIIIEVKNV